MARPTDQVADPFIYLTEDHRSILSIIEAIRAGSERAVHIKEELLAELQSALSLHTEIEEQIVYPVLEEIEETRSRTLESYAEHQIIKLTMQELALMSAATEEWAVKLRALSENLTHHLREEEDTLFVSARHALGETKVREMGEKMQKFLRRIA